MFVECNKSKFHRWCSSCVKNGFGIDFEKLLQNNTTCWPKGCPICTNSCHCSLCRKRSLGEMAQKEATMAVVVASAAASAAVAASAAECRAAAAESLCGRESPRKRRRATSEEECFTI